MAWDNFAKPEALNVRFGTVLLGIICFFASGCAMDRTRLPRASLIANLGSRPVVQVTPQGKGKEVPYLLRFAKSIPKPSERTQLLIRRYGLETQYEEDPDVVIRWFQELAETRPTIDEVHGLAEIAEIQANWAVETGDPERAAGLYATAVVYAYQFLFDEKLNVARNAYDPQFRSICDVYNRSLEGMLREVCKSGQLESGQSVKVGNQQQGIEFEFRIDGRWSEQEFERFELVNDYHASGIDNHYHTYGLGVPLIAIRKQQPIHSAFEKFYPPALTLPLTAFMHLLPADETSENGTGRKAVLTLYDPLEKTQVTIKSKVVPLESDITTPLAYGLRDPLLSRGLLATASLLNADFAPETYGMFMLEPYDPNKIPVVMVHGLWSNPVTWVHMFNDLRANQDIHENCQFWFYSYPTGQPFWISAQQMRRDLANIRRELDPNGDSRPLDQMVMVAHSMGGLISIMQTMESEDNFWNIISDQPIESLEGDKETIELLRDTFYFHPNRAVDRIVTLATPLKGSEFANSATRWVSQKLFTLPAIVTNDFERIARQNKGKFKTSSFLTTATSIDSLAAGNPVFEAFENAKQDSSVKMHTIIGRLPKKTLLGVNRESQKFAGDGIVSVESAKNDKAISQIYVPVEHSEIHHHPSAIYEVQRILLEHLASYDRIRVREIPDIPLVGQSAPEATVQKPVRTSEASGWLR
ncbi:MAG: esterase/lipase family protein [Mariniblastus sp.]